MRRYMRRAVLSLALFLAGALSVSGVDLVTYDANGKIASLCSKCGDFNNPVGFALAVGVPISVRFSFDRTAAALVRHGSLDATFPSTLFRVNAGSITLTMTNPRLLVVYV